MHYNTLRDHTPCVNFDATSEMKELLFQLGGTAFKNCNSAISSTMKSKTINAVYQSVLQDLITYHERDPSIRHKPISCLLSIHSTFFAVLSYRLAHELIKIGNQKSEFVREAMHLSYSARSNTGVEIHPDAVIGVRFVVDHGWGTVIGQTVEIGDDCYILNNVTLGGRGVANAIDGKRHPTLGNRVQVCAGAKVFGPVTINDDSFIGPDTTITHDIPKGSTILQPNLYSLEPSTLNKNAPSSLDVLS